MMLSLIHLSKICVWIPNLLEEFWLNLGFQHGVSKEGYLIFLNFSSCSVLHLHYLYSLNNAIVFEIDYVFLEMRFLVI